MFFTIIQYEKIVGPKKLTVLFIYMLLAHTKKSPLKSKISLLCVHCTYPSLGKKDILSTLSEPCYCHVGEGLAGQPLDKAGQVNAQAAADGSTGDR